MGRSSPWSARNCSFICSVASIGRNSAAGSPVNRERKKTITIRTLSDSRLAIALCPTSLIIAAHRSFYGKRRRNSGAARIVLASLLLEADFGKLELPIGGDGGRKVQPLANPTVADHVE